MTAPSPTFANCKVVLVRPKIAANLGATARAMRNFGLWDLVLVQPEADREDPRGWALATHSQDVLDKARAASSLAEAVADCGLVAGTSARVGGRFRKQAVGAPDQIMPRLIEALPAGPVALVFGPEDSGLLNEEIAQCHYLITIPTDDVHPALNLAQAVAVCLYELRRTWLGRPSSLDGLQPVASFEAQNRMFAKLREGLEAVHFLYGTRADSLFHAVRHLIGRARPSPMETDVLIGLARQLLWVGEQLRKDEP